MRRIKRYKTENSKTVLELNIANLEQLFDKRDPNPYRSKDLDDDIVEYLVSSAQEVGYRSLGAIEIITQIEMTKEEHQDLDVAIREFFLYREEITLKQLRTTFVLGLKTLVIGSTFLSLAIVLPVMIENTWLVSLWISSYVKVCCLWGGCRCGSQSISFSTNGGR